MIYLRVKMDCQLQKKLSSEELGSLILVISVCSVGKLIRKNRLIGDFCEDANQFTPPTPQHFGNPNNGTIFCCDVSVYFI